MTEPVSIALCGAGMIARAHALAATSIGARVIAVASRTDETAHKFANEIGARVVSYAQLPAGADVVVVATPPAAHFDHAAHALERGAAVLLEKPLVTTLNEADRLVDLADRHGNRILYAENLAYAPITLAAIRTVASIAAKNDPLLHLEVRSVQSLPAWGNFTSPEWGGGALFDLGVHPLAVAVVLARVARAGEVVSVSARLRGDATDTHADVDLVFESGLVAKVVSSWEGSDVPSWDAQMSWANDVVRAEYFPTLNLEHNGETIALPRSTGAVPFISDLGYEAQLRSLLDDMNNRATPFMDVRFGRWILEIVCAAYVSAASDGQSTTVPSGCDRRRTPLDLWKNPPSTS